MFIKQNKMQREYCFRSVNKIVQLIAYESNNYYYFKKGLVDSLKIACEPIH